MVIQLWPDLRVITCRGCDAVIALFSWDDALQCARLVRGMRCRECGREIGIPSHAEERPPRPEERRQYEARGFVW